MDTSSRNIGKRIRFFRKRSGFTQHELASQVGFKSKETISQIERGDREIKAWELAELSRILSADINDLLRDEKPDKNPAVLWRQSPKEQKKLKETLFLKRCRQYALLNEMSGRKSGMSFPQKSVDLGHLSFETAEQSAVEVRREFSLGDRPAQALESTLQNVFGVIIWYMDLGEGSAASTIGPFGPAILMNSNEAPWRRHFNFAHELFHLITWKSIPPRLLNNQPDLWNRVEKVANVFASSLLLPSESVNLELNKYVKTDRVTYNDIIIIARDFGVSSEALLYRLLNMKRLKQATLDKILKDPIFRKIDHSTMAPQWWQPLNIPERFVRLAFVAYQMGKLSRVKLSEMLDTSLIDLPNILQEYGLSDTEGYDAEVRTI
jgi:Zn-dependent peptidase ImmA (M78 family)/DNA-binding XRE family transcriptional regulator